MESRPTPEQMLARASEQEGTVRRGRLKIFFGMAPGVGKTYALLEEARARQAAGVDVLVGWIESHGRRETARLAQGLPVLPPKRIDYRGLVLEEFDLEAALARRPALILLDELAHTNVAGSRHAKRWEDAEELRQAGIDVYTTLNVQHVESLNDLVTDLTGVVVRETVPDSVFDSADDIELVDLPPDDLLLRMSQGKVYGREQAERATQGFFRKSNLLALRELALRRTAERVDAQRSEHRRLSGEVRGGTTRERLLVAVGPSPSSADVVRAAARLAYRLRAHWLAVAVESAGLRANSPEDQERITATLALAQRLGAETLVLEGQDPAEQLADVARQRGITRIVLGRPDPGHRPASPWRQDLLGRLLARAPGCDVVVTRGLIEPEARPAKTGRRPLHLASHLLALLAVAILVALCWLGKVHLSVADQTMVLLLGVLCLATRLPRAATLSASVASVACLDFFFVEPRFTFLVNDQRYFVTFAVMLALAVATATFTTRFRRQAEDARDREGRTATVFAMSRQFVIETSLASIAGVAVGNLRDLLGADVQIWIADSKGQLTASSPQRELAISEQDLAIAHWVFRNGRAAGHGTSTLPSSDWVFFPLVGSSGHLGVVGMRIVAASVPPTPSAWQIAETYIAQTALAIERALLVERASAARVDVERERTRSTLLASISHDIRTPLATILGAASTLEAALEMPDSDRRKLLAAIRSEASRLSALVTDLLELTRLESDEFELSAEVYPLEEVLLSSLQHLTPILHGRPVRQALPEEVLLARIDPLLIEQALMNLLDNAVKYSPPGSPIEVELRRDGELALISIADNGPGLPAGQEERIFERFYRLEDGQRNPGTGLGLALVQTIVRLHAGRVAARNRPGGGACFTIALPSVRSGTLPEEST